MRRLSLAVVNVPPALPARGQALPRRGPRDGRIRAVRGHPAVVGAVAVAVSAVAIVAGIRGGSARHRSVGRGAPAAAVATLAPAPPSVEPATPGASDPLLTTSLSFVLSPPELHREPVGAVEYGWSPNSAHPPGAVARWEVGGPGARLDYRATTPNRDWWLWARSVGRDGRPGEWRAHRVRTPPPALLVALGDSVTSGQHAGGFAGTATVCDDPAFGYAHDLAIVEEASVASPAWFSPATDYVNAAHSGFSLADVLAGAHNACGGGRFDPLAQVAAALDAHRGSWERVVISAGINDTNWVRVLTGAIAANLAFPHAEPAALLASWDGDRRAPAIESLAGAVIRKLRSVAPAVRITWFGYYDPAGTTGLFPSSFRDPVDRDLDVVHGAIRRGIADAGGGVEWVDTAAKLSGRADLVQPLGVLRGAGWPHPSAAGASVIAAAGP